DNHAAVLGAHARISALNAEIEKAEGVLFDIPSPGSRSDDEWDFDYARLTRLKPSQPAVAPTQRSIVHFGYHPASLGYSGYTSSFSNPYRNALTPQPGKPLKVAFVARARANLPAIALALADSGDAVIVSQRQLTEAQFATKKAIHLSDGLVAVVRISELDYRGPHGLRADMVVGDGRDPLGAALELLKHARRRTTRSPIAPAPLPPGRWRADAEYKDMEFPPLEYRILAVFRIWGVIRYFYPYLHLITEDWDEVLKTFIVRMHRARNAEEYALSAAEMATHVPDGHT